MEQVSQPIAVWQLYGESSPFPDVLHIERIVDRAGGLDWVIAPHRHLHLHQVFLLIEGEISLTVDGVAIPLAPPMVINIPRGAVHAFRFSACTDGYVLTLPATDFPDLFGSSAEAAVAIGRVFVAAPSRVVVEGFRHLHDAHGRAGRLRKTALRAAATALVCEILERSGVESGNGSTGAVDSRIAAFQALVAETLRTRLSIGEYAARLGMSSRHLRRLCAEVTGLSAQAYVEEQVLREACRLLVYTRMSVQAIGYALGFEDPAYFSRFFLRGAGLTPTAYRVRFEQPLAG